MIVAEAVGGLLAAAGVRAAFGVVGSGNFHLTNALVSHGVRFVAARHEGGAATMADAYARMTGEVAVVSVHQGPGLTNAITGLAEAAKSRTPLVVLAGEATDARSNFHIDQDAAVRAVGAVPMRVTGPAEAARHTLEAFRVARDERRTVVLNLPLDVQAAETELGGERPERAAGTELGGERPERAAGTGPGGERPDYAGASELDRAAAAVRESRPGAPAASAEQLDGLRRLLDGAERPVFVAGRGARHARAELVELAERTGALLATSAVAKGLFRGSPWDLDVSGGFATPLTAELVRGADLVVGWGCALNMWTTRHGSLIGPGAKVAQVDLDLAAVGLHVPADHGVVGDVAEVARALTAGGERAGYRSPELARRIREEGRWRAVPYHDESGGGRIDPRTLTIGLDDLLPAERIVATDSGNFMGYPAMFLDVPDERGFCFTQAFQAVGLGLATAIGAAVARPDRLPVAALGDGGAFMGIAELETVVRLGLPMVVVVYDDEAYGAEVHHFGPHGHPLGTVRFPPADLAAIARGYGFAAVTVTGPADLAGVAEWLKGPRERPLLVHAKVTGDRPSWWLEEAFKGH
ncbi:thiamine pyrophosphate-binding protein [Nonomuraea ferruginea]|uniref:Thiamine pyrophosphate-binding protein n=1 Tax=Nonomuraea ferruginea TaxID=46174 RepID=A0ABT4T3E3_9ACTN|nr:thiamine pyrophosphate-binding protein [Nonomuraea ferruginea]MDA0644048.1 thiamine pyrophosphate-binding protein [Nonomuraea ferruginea]